VSAPLGEVLFSTIIVENKAKSDCFGRLATGNSVRITQVGKSSMVNRISERSDVERIRA
jgi:hypothetical protein